MPNRIEIARTAQRKWAALSVRGRVKLLRRLRYTIASHVDRLVKTISDELGKPPLDALTGDVLVTLEHLRFYEQCAAKVLRPRFIGKPAFLYSGAGFQEFLEPYGVALIFAPWNYPLQLAMVPAITALFAGNAVVLKCSEHAPKTAALIAAMCAEAGLPENLIQVSWESSEKSSALIAAIPNIIFFTGSSRHGREVAEHAATLFIPTILELGGKDACLIFASCDLKRTVGGVAYSAFSNAGQVCVGSKRIFAEQPIYDAFLNALIARSRELRIGTGMEADMGPVRFEFVRKLLAEQVDEAVAMGATLHTKWDRSSEAVPPLILTRVPPEARLLTEETFGPVVCVANFDDEEEAVRLANNSPYALSASVYTGDAAQGRRIAAAVNAGSCTINDGIRSVGNPYAAFGGNSASGHGRYHGPAGLLAFSRTKTVMTVHRFRPREIHWFPFQAKTFNQLRRLLRFRHGRGSALKRIGSLFAIVFLCCALAGARAHAGVARGTPTAIDVALPLGAHGSIAYLVFTSANGFPSSRKKALRHGFAPVSGGEAHQQVDLGPFPPGHYAISIYLDVNGNHKLDKGLLAFPGNRSTPRITRAGGWGLRILRTAFLGVARMRRPFP